MSERWRTTLRMMDGDEEEGRVDVKVCRFR